MLKPPDSFLAAADTAGIALDAAEIERLGRYLHTLLETNKQFNLTAIREPQQAWMRHILDSLSLLPFITEAKTLIDVGSGGGLPGMVLAIMRPQIKVTLLESTGKKAMFLGRTAAELGLPQVNVITDRAEVIGRQDRHRGRYDIATARAIGPMNVLLELLLPLVKVGGSVLALKGAKVQQELADAGDALMILGAGEVEAYEALPGMEDESVIVQVHKERPTPKQYPRRPGVPKSEPL